MEKEVCVYLYYLYPKDGWSKVNEWTMGGLALGS